MRIQIKSAGTATSGRGNWRTRAACREWDPELFFSASSQEAAADEVTAAKAVCQRCPVLRECLGYALETRQRFGVWGGTSESERELIHAGLAKLTANLTGRSPFAARSTLGSRRPSHPPRVAQ